jgi:hypothetical protein
MRNPERVILTRGLLAPLTNRFYSPKLSAFRSLKPLKRSVLLLRINALRLEWTFI